MTHAPPPDGIAGLVTAIVTPFNLRGQPDLGALKSLLDFQLDQGVDALFALGTSGDGLMLSGKERRTIAEEVVGWVDRRVPVLIHCGAVDTRSAVALARHARDIGSDGVAAIGPLFHQYNQAAIYRHFAAVSDACGPEAFFIYDNPARVGYQLDASLVLRLIRERPSVVGVKDTGNDLARLVNYLSVEPNARFFTGSNVLVLPALVMGAKGAVSTLANVVPELFVALLSSFRSGEIENARRHQLLVARLQAAIAGLPYIPSVKHLLGLRGLPAGTAREPMEVLSASEAQTINDRLAPDEELSEWLHAS